MTFHLDTWVRVAGPQHGDDIRRHRESAAREALRYRGSLRVGERRGINCVEYVGGLGNTVMGSLSACESSAGVWQITHVHVMEVAREIGIGDMMLSRCLFDLADMGATWCGGLALPGDRAMKNLFERHGLVAQAIEVGRELSARSNGADASR